MTIAVLTTAGGSSLPGYISLLQYVPTTSAAYKPCRLSAPLNNTGSTVTCNSGLYVISCVSGCNWTQADVGSAIVVLQERSINAYQSTILSVQSTTQCTLNDPATFSSTNAFCYFGTDSTSAIDQALSAAKSTNQALYIPSGFYFYSGIGLSGWKSPCIYGNASTLSIIFLGVGKYFVDGNEYWLSIDVNHLGFFGGGGGIRNRYTTTDVTSGAFNIELCYFRDYASAAVSFNSGDFPYLSINNNYFQGQNDSQSIGVAAAGAGPGTIFDNAFVYNCVHVKLGSGGVFWKIIDNDFIQFALESPPSSYSRASIWLVPTASYTNGIGCTTAFNKFGNENLDTQDVRILLADNDPSSGAYFGDQLWLTAQSTGYITGCTFDENLIEGGATGTGPGVNPIIYSYTRNFRSQKVTGNIQDTAPGYVLQFDPVVTVANDFTTVSNIFGPFQMDGTNLNGVMLASNIPGYASIVDPDGDFYNGDPSAYPAFPSGDSGSDFTNLLTTPITGFSVVSGSSITPISDPFGSTEAVTFTLGTGTGNLLGKSFTMPTLGQRCWVDLYLRSGSSGTSVTSIKVGVTNSPNTATVIIKVVNLSTTWGRYRIPFVPRATPLGGTIALNFFSALGSQVGLTADIAVVRVYQASEPSNGGLFLNPPSFRGVNKTGATAFTPGGSNCPAGNGTTPYTWVQIIVADGSLCYLPAFK